MQRQRIKDRRQLSLIKTIIPEMTLVCQFTKAITKIWHDYR